MPRSERPTPRPCACTTVRTASRLLARVYDAALQGTDLNVTQLAVLRAIERMEGEPLSRVAEQLSMDRTSVYRSVATMQRHGWVALDEGRDARSRSAVITDEGRAVLDRADPHWEAVQTAVVDRFGRRRWSALVEELSRLGEIADAVADNQSEVRAEERPE